MLMGKRRREKEEKRESGSETFEGSQEWGRSAKLRPITCWKALGRLGMEPGVAPRLSSELPGPQLSCLLGVCVIWRGSITIYTGPLSLASRLPFCLRCCVTLCSALLLFIFPSPGLNFDHFHSSSFPLPEGLSFSAPRRNTNPTPTDRELPVSLPSVNNFTAPPANNVWPAWWKLPRSRGQVSQTDSWRSVTCHHQPTIQLA